MKTKINLPLLNLLRRPGRTAALAALSLVLSFCILAGALVISGLQKGLNSLEERLGADIMVVPYEAATKSDLSNIILQGNPGYFYMDKGVAEKIMSREGIGQVSSQLFLASVSSSCCSYKIQLIGFDPDTDFTITPWIDRSEVKELGYMEVYVGSDLNAFVGDEIEFYNTTVKVAGRLERTGTYLDTAAYGNLDTLKSLIAAAKELGIAEVGKIDPEQVVSSVLINVAEGYTVEEVLNDINIHVRGVEAVRTQNMISDVSNKLLGVSDLAGILIALVWLLVIGIMILVFAMIANERKKEFATLRIIGMSRAGLAAVIFKETLYVSLVGAASGALLAVLLSSLFTRLIESSLGLPYLLPKASTVAIIAVAAILATILAASISAAFSANKISKVDAALILRGEN